ncbi:CsbD family protein [Brevundimonas balnearis]|uniref:CsbD family protein n=1 Tax=Brevundimonas balnearis TaxID=1572858 RepID=A0ABV6R4K0_9CAUL
MNTDRIEGAGKQTEGKLKEGVGKLTGDEKLKAEGKMDQVEGKVQNAVGGAKDALKGDGRH